MYSRLRLRLNIACLRNTLRSDIEQWTQPRTPMEAGTSRRQTIPCVRGDVYHYRYAVHARKYAMFKGKRDRP